MKATSGPAPPFDCARCHRRIGKTATHYLIKGRRAVCHRCLERSAHRELFPDCPEDWHDVYDHLVSTASRAAIAVRLGLWP